MSRIVGLNDLKKKEEGKEDKKQEQLFAGGLDQRGNGSGINVLGPPSRSDGSDRFAQIARAAAESGAAIDGVEGTRTITIYRNGFAVDNGPLRDFNSPENAQFIAELQRGRLPRELGTTSETDVNLVDKHEEDYVPPAYIPFSKANSLGAVEVLEGSFVLDPDIVSSLLDVPDPVDEGKPVTTIQIRTLTGQRLKIRINQDATILQLATVIKSQYTTNDSYILTAGFPPTDLNDPAATILEAGLLNAVVTMKKV